VKRADRAVILEQFKMIYRAENLEMTVQALEDFIMEELNFFKHYFLTQIILLFKFKKENKKIS